MTDLFAHEAALRAVREPYASATVVRVRQPTSSHPGDRALVTADGVVHGWVGGSCTEPVVVRESLAVIAAGEPRLLEVPMECASEGEVEVFIEPHLPTPHVVAVGSAPLLTLLHDVASALGWSVDVVEDPSSPLGGLPVDPDTYVVVATFGRYDEDAVAAALATPAAYVGLVASAKRSSAVRAALLADGVDEVALSRLHAPAGLDLGSLQHREIAVALLAELVAVEASRRGRSPVDLAADLAVDPVCGMAVEPATAVASAEHEGMTYWFCSAGCRRRFETDPSAFVPA